MTTRIPPQQAYLNHVVMIESKIEPNSPSYKKVQLPATIFNRSPLRQRFGNNNMANGRCSPSKKTGLSPLRSRRMENNAAPSNIIRVTSREREQTKHTVRKGFCENHESKPANFYVSSNSSSGEYCQKCAILLASQGCKVSRLEDHRSVKMLSSGQNDAQLAIDNPARRLQMNRFLDDLKHISQLIRNKKSQNEDELTQSHHYYQQQEHLITDYYNTLIMCLEDHKIKILQQLAFAKSSSEMPAIQLSQMFDQSLGECEEMRSDIYSSVKAINAVDEKSFRPVMDTYKERAERMYRELNTVSNESLSHPQLTLNDPRQVSRHMLGMIEIGLVERQASQPSLREKKNSVYFSFDNQQQADEQHLLEPKQEMIETQDQQSPRMVTIGHSNHIDS